MSDSGKDSDKDMIEKMCVLLRRGGKQVNASKLCFELAGRITAAGAEEQALVQVQIIIQNPGHDPAIEVLDELSIATIKELTASAWIVRIELSHHASLCE